MIAQVQAARQRILVVDDNPAIHDDFHRIFAAQHGRGGDAESEVFGSNAEAPDARPGFVVDSAYQGEEGLARVHGALQQEQPYAVAFVDVRMPPGWDGVETGTRILRSDGDIQLVICTAYADHSWHELLERIGHSDRLVILKKPFDPIEVQQLACALSGKWQLARESRAQLRNADARLRVSEERYRQVFERNPHPMWIYDLETLRFLMVNRAALEQYGYSEREFLGMTLRDIRPLDGAQDSSDPASGLWRHRRRDGAMREVEMSSELIDFDGRAASLVLARDVTGERNAQRLAAQELSRINRARRMLSACNEALVRAEDEQQLLARICRVAVDIGGYRMAWVGYAVDDAQQSIRPVAHAGHDDGYLAQLRLSWAPGQPTPSARAIRNSEVTVVTDLPADVQLQAWHAAGSAHGYRSAVCLPLLGDARTFGVLTLYAGEVTTIGTDEIELLQELADNLAFGITNLREREERRHMQEAVLKIAQGVSAGSGAEFFGLLASSLAQALQADAVMVAQPAEGRRPSLVPLALVCGVCPREHAPLPLAGSVCERATAQVLLVERDARREFPRDRLLSELDAQGCALLALHGAQGQRLGWLVACFAQPIARPELVRSMLRIFGSRAAAELERTADAAHSQEQASLLDHAHDAIVVRGIDDRIRYWNKGAERMFGYASAEALGRTIEDLLCNDAGALHGALTGVMEAGAWSGQLEHRRKDGSALNVAAQWTLVSDAAGRPKSILCILTDITRRLAMERQLEQSQRLEAVGQLTGGVAHDFNNLLTVILGNSELLAERLADQPRMHLLADMIRGAAQRGAELTNRLLAFARRQTLKPQSVDVGQLLAGMEPLLRRALREDIELNRVHTGDLWQALVDPAQLESAVLNLCINARDAMPGGGKLAVEACNAWLDGDMAAQYPELQPGAYVLVAVSDTGTGIAPEHLKKVFEPFFTTKEFGKGTGLGLSMVYGFVKQSQGHVNIYSELGHGTTVKMFLPRADRAAALREAPAEPISALRGSETVLLAEDNDAVRVYAESQLGELGYRVVAVRNAAEALDCLRRGDGVDLLFTDVVMPGGMNGPELAAAARALRPQLRVLFTSGYTDHAIAGHSRFAAGELLLNKPYRRIELARKLRIALQQEPA